jgi:hypothetical protein
VVVVRRQAVAAGANGLDLPRQQYGFAAILLRQQINV